MKLTPHFSPQRLEEPSIKVNCNNNCPCYGDCSKRRRNNVAMVAIIGLLMCLSSSCRRTPQPTAVPGASAPTAGAISSATDEQIIAFCGGCHAMPKPSSFPQSAWYDEVKRGFDFHHQSRRKDLTPPPVASVVEYFRSRAPATLAVAPDKSVSGSDDLRFGALEITLESDLRQARPAAISFVSRWPAPEEGLAHEQSQKSVSDKVHHRARGEILLSDMANGGVYLVPPDGKTTPRRLAKLEHPAAGCRCDLNGNGRADLVIADLGSFSPADHDRGRVMWLADVDDNLATRTAVPLMTGLGRVADVRSADFDADGDQDLVVAEFGWHKTGRVLWLRNDGDARSPDFTIQVVDPRPGAIHVPVVDLNRDGRPDFVALISQEFEVVEAFLNQGDGTFAKQTIHSALDPAFGSSGIQVVDLDGDGDQDVLATNGDMFDSFLIKPYHGIQWLENTGAFPFVPHWLTSFPGVHRALAGDLDGDGDLDIVAGAFLPAAVRDSAVGKTLESLIWLEQQRPGEFVRHALETGNCTHAALELADLDGDGVPEIAVGAFRDRGSSNQSAVTIRHVIPRPE